MAEPYFAKSFGNLNHCAVETAYRIAEDGRMKERLLRSCFKNIQGQKFLGFCQMPKPDFAVFRRALSLLPC